jgi:VIT1/CCC1 family predicted Fe2+/Mn2+ transporter
MPHREKHGYHRTGWLRAAVLGANDGIVSTTSLVIGVAAASATRHDVLVAGTAGLVAGAMSMAAGEYVSVSSQRDTERADLAREQRELLVNPGAELAELIAIYEARGLEPSLARQVAERLTEHDALVAHARDELGITDDGRARPGQAAAVSAASFASGAALPLLTLLALDEHATIPVVAGTALVFLAGLGMLGARVGRAPVARAALRVLIGGGLAMAATAGIGRLVGAL